MGRAGIRQGRPFGLRAALVFSSAGRSGDGSIWTHAFGWCMSTCSEDCGILYFCVLPDLSSAPGSDGKAVRIPRNVEVIDPGSLRSGSLHLVLQATTHCPPLSHDAHISCAKPKAAGEPQAGPGCRWSPGARGPGARQGPPRTPQGGVRVATVAAPRHSRSPRSRRSDHNASHLLSLRCPALIMVVRY